MSYMVEISYLWSDNYTPATYTTSSQSLKEIEDFVLYTVANEHRVKLPRLITIKLASPRSVAKYAFSRFYDKNSLREDLMENNHQSMTFATPTMLRDALRVLKQLVS